MSDKPPHDCRLQKRNARDSEEPPSPGRLIYFPYPVDCCIAYRHALIFPKYQPLSQREIILSADGAHGAWAQYCTSRMPPICSTACRCTLVCPNIERCLSFPEGKSAVGGTPTGPLPYFPYAARLQCSMPPCFCLFSTASAVHSPRRGEPDRRRHPAARPPAARAAREPSGRATRGRTPPGGAASPRAAAGRCAALCGAGGTRRRTAARYGGAGKQRSPPDITRRTEQNLRFIANSYPIRLFIEKFQKPLCIPALCFSKRLPLSCIKCENSRFVFKRGQGMVTVSVRA